MYRLLAVNESQALYVHRSDTPDQPVEPFSYLNDLLSIRSAAGFVSFLKNHPQGLKELEKSHTVDWEIKFSRLVSHFDTRFEFSDKVIMNAATACGVEYLDAMTDISGHYDEVSAEIEFSNRVRAFVDKYGRDATWTPEMEEEYATIWETSPKADLYRLEYRRLGYLTDRIEALLLLAASVKGDTELRKKFVIRQDEKMFSISERVGTYVAVPYETVLEVLPSGMSPSKMEDKLRKASKAKQIALLPIQQDWDEIEFSDDPRPFREMGLQIKLMTVFDEPEYSITLAINDIVAFALSEWIAHFASMQGVSSSYEKGLTIRESKMNDVVLELANIVVEGRIGVCPVCGRPFVVKRKPNAKGRLNKKYCTDSCKVRDSATSRRKGGDA